MKQPVFDTTIRSKPRQAPRVVTKAYNVIVDLDGTMCNTTWRQHLVATKPRNWNGFFAGIPHDTPNYEVLNVVKGLALAGNTIIFVSGRGDEYRAQTETWLDQYCDFPFDGPYMRAAGDHRDDTVVKKEIYDFLRAHYGTENWFAIDDRQRVVDMWREQGIMCMQVAPGNF